MKISKQILFLGIAGMLLLPLAVSSSVDAAEKKEKKNEVVCFGGDGEVIKELPCDSKEFTSADSKRKGKAKKSDANKPAPESCKNRLEKINNFKGMLANFKDYSYSDRFRALPADPNSTVIEVKNWKQPGKKDSVPTKTGYIKFKIEGKDARRINYELVIQRHEDAINIFRTQPTVNIGTYQAEINKFRGEITKASAQVDKLAARWDRVNKNANCNNRIEAAKVKLLTREMSRIWKEAKATRDPVKQASKDTSRAYKNSAREYKKVIAKSSSTKKPNPGGAQAPN